MRRKPNKYHVIFAGLFLLIAVGLGFAAHYQADALIYVKESIVTLRIWQQEYPLAFILGYAAAYILAMIIFLPADTIFMTLAGAIFTVPTGAFVACTVHTTGTMTTFYLSRYLIRRSRREHEDIVSPPAAPPTTRQRWNAWLTLVLLRLAPLIPTHAISLMMAASPLSPKGFYTATWLGSMPLTLFMVFIGRKLTEIDSLDDIMTPEVILGFCGLMAAIALAKVIYARQSKIKA